MSDITESAVDLVETALLTRLDAASARRPFILGLCGAQGSGKTTLCAALEARLAARGLAVASLSLDDLYLPREARAVLAQTTHPLLQTRGVPGTHDVALGLDLFEALTEGRPATLPRFDKALDTRLPITAGSRIEGPLDALLFEGWCVGSIPQAPEALEEPVNALERDEDPDGDWRRWVNAQLAGAYQTLFGRLDMLTLLAAPGFECVARWRLEQEEDLRRRLDAEGRSATRVMTEGEIGRFIAHYERLTRHILAEMPGRADVTIRLDAARRVVR